MLKAEVLQATPRVQTHFCSIHSSLRHYKESVLTGYRRPNKAVVYGAPHRIRYSGVHEVPLR